MPLHPARGSRRTRKNLCWKIGRRWQMPELTGFDVLSALPTAGRPLVVFVTAFDSHAIRAFEVHAVDYLLKPFSENGYNKSADEITKRVRTRIGLCDDEIAEPLAGGGISIVVGGVARNDEIIGVVSAIEKKTNQRFEITCGGSGNCTRMPCTAGSRSAERQPARIHRPRSTASGGSS